MGSELRCPSSSSLRLHLKKPVAWTLMTHACRWLFQSLEAIRDIPLLHLLTQKKHNKCRLFGVNGFSLAPILQLRYPGHPKTISKENLWLSSSRKESLLPGNSSRLASYWWRILYIVAPLPGRRMPGRLLGIFDMIRLPGPSG